jgi:hypothetical protein
MDHRRAQILSLSGRAALAAGLALAAAYGAACAPAPPVAPEETLVVVAPKTPKVIATYPREGETVPGGPLVLKIVFDQPMRPEAWAYGPAPGGRFPDCLDRPRLLDDHKTFVLLCSASLNAAFALSVNAAPDFTGTGGRAAEPYVLRFSTSGDPSTGLAEALKSASLTEADDPIMTASAAQGAVTNAHEAAGAQTRTP